MEKQDIISGLRNAVDRGYTLELAVQSFMNAGYSQQDVLDSAKVLGYNSSIISKSPIMTQIQQQSFPQQPQQQIQQNSQQMLSQPLPQTKSLVQISQAVRQPELPPVPQPPQTFQPAQKPVQINISDNDIRKQRSFLAENWIIILLSILLLLLLVGLSLSIFAQDIVLSFLKTLGINVG